MPRLEFKGKSFVWNHHLAVPYHELIPVPEKSVLAYPPVSNPADETPVAQGSVPAPSLHDNLIIHGDNLKALKALLPTYAGRIKCIYIDPPYNTGKVNESWKYNDNVNSPYIKEWLGKVVDKEDLTRHDKWLCMMTPRLNVLKDLLTNNGLIFISIDENELNNLRCLLNAVFFEQNYLGTIVWQTATDNNATQIAIEHEYIVCYARDINSQEDWDKPSTKISVIISKFNELKEKYGSDIESIQDDLTAWINDRKNGSDDLSGISHYRYVDDKGVWYPGNSANTRPGGYNYDIIHPLTQKVCAKPDNGYRWPEKTFNEAKERGDIDWGESEKSVPHIKKRIETATELLKSTYYEDNRKSTRELKSIMGTKAFNNPKSVKLLKKIFRFTTSPDSIILDSFAGSGTTAHAVLALNKEDGGNRKFILVECEDYADTITAERVRRVIKGVPGAKDPNLKAGLGGTFSYYELGDPFDIEGVLSAKSLPSFESLGRYIFQTATGVPLDLAKIDQEKFYLGSLDNRDVYMIYKPDIEFLKKEALTLEFAQALPNHNNRIRLIFGPQKFLDDEFCREYRIEFQQLPYEIHKFRE